MNTITVENVSKKYHEQTVLDDVSMSFEQGKIHGIIGRNGSGKTLLFKSICGFIPIDSGKITANGKQIGKDVDILPDAGIIIEAPGFLQNYSAYNNLKFLADIKKHISNDKIKTTLALVGLVDVGRKHVGKFSLGMRQRLGIAQAIMEDPDILIFDEPFNGLDEIGVDDIRKLLISLKEAGRTILIASHTKEDIDLLCDTVYRMDQGKVV